MMEWAVTYGKVKFRDSSKDNPVEKAPWRELFIVTGNPHCCGELVVGHLAGHTVEIYAEARKVLEGALCSGNWRKGIRFTAVVPSYYDNQVAGLKAMGFQEIGPVWKNPNTANKLQQYYKDTR